MTVVVRDRASVIEGVVKVILVELADVVGATLVLQELKTMTKIKMLQEIRLYRKDLIMPFIPGNDLLPNCSRPRGCSCRVGLCSTPVQRPVGVSRRGFASRQPSRPWACRREGRDTITPL